MKKILLLILCVIPFALYAQEIRKVNVKAGTIVPLESTSNVRASEVQKGQTVNFRVVRDVVIDGVTVIPIGTISKGTVYEAKRSSWWGTKGRLGIKLRNLTLPSGEQLYFADSDIYITGKNRTPLSVVTALFVWPCMFICGSKAEMKIGYEIDAAIASNSTVSVEL